MEEDEEHFRCAVCLELVYKPIVQACGHVFCFWCVFHAMNGSGESSCPLCRSTYTHFPRICELLHTLLLKEFPEEYRCREEATKHEEIEKYQFESPDLQAAQSREQDASKVTKDDFVCRGCNELLCHPVALNCGHVFCEACLPAVEAGSMNCTLCSFSHRVFPLRVCLELDSYLKRSFPVEYAQRDQGRASAPSSNVNNSDSVNKDQEHPPSIQQQQQQQQQRIFFGVGCDTCGMHPIFGRRFKCLDCPTPPGFDLCEECYSSGRGSTEGRFKMQHTAEHNVVEVRDSSADFRGFPAIIFGRMDLGGLAEADEDEFSERESEEEDEGTILNMDFYVRGSSSNLNFEN